MRPALLSLAFALCLTAVPAAAEVAKPLFNGTSLAGWQNVNCAPGTFFVKEGEIITTGTPTGFLRTDRQYENFELEMDWMHVNKKEIANSGLFVWGDPLPGVGTPYTRGIEVQVLINYPKVDWATNHGDIFSIHGAKCKPDRPHPKGYERCLPSEERVKGGGEWNHYKVIANDGVIKLHVNGKEVSGVSQCSPRKGYLALESEGAECHFKNLKIKELPSTNPKPEEIANVWAGHTSLFNGIDLTGWTTNGEQWKVKGEKLVCDGRANLMSNAKYGPFELQFDWKLPAKPEKGGGRIGLTFASGTVPVWDLTGLMAMNHGDIGFKDEKTSYDVKTPVKANSWARSVVRFDGTTLRIKTNGTEIYTGTTKEPRAADAIAISPGEGLEIMNVFLRELKEK